MATRRPRNGGPGRAKRQSVELEVGRRLRAQREASQLSLRELARRLELSPSAISQIETGKSRPSVSTLYAIVSELGMSLDELFSGANRDGQAVPAPPGTPTSSTHPRPAPDVDSVRTEQVQRAGTRKAIDLETGVRWERLTPHADPDADFLYVIYDVGGASCHGDRFIRHSGREYGLVLSGTLEVTVGFDRYVLGHGDSICFDSTAPHCLRTVGSEPVHGVWFVIGRQNDQRAQAFSGGSADRE